MNCKEWYAAGSMMSLGTVSHRKGTLSMPVPFTPHLFGKGWSNRYPNSGLSEITGWQWRDV